MQMNLDERDYCCLKRRKNNIKLITVSKYVGCTMSMLSQWERGEANLSSDKVKKCIKFLEQYKQVGM